MGWKVAADRYLMVNRRWLPRWRFQPAEKLEDAFRLLEQAAPRNYRICGDDTGSFHVTVQIAERTGEANGPCKPLTITYAIARAIGIEVEP